MGSVAITTSRMQRLGSVVLVGIIFLLLEITTGMVLSTQALAYSDPAMWILYACYGLSSLLFYGIGSFCWLYAYGKQHTVATLLFLFTCFMMIAFSSLSASAMGNGVFTSLSNASTALAILFFFFLLLYFPFAISTRVTGRVLVLLRVTRFVLAVLCTFTTVRAVCVYLFHYAAPSWWVFVSVLYYLLTALAIIAVIIYATRRVTTLREKQQSRFFFLGTLLSFVPIVGLTVLPTLFHSHFVVDGTLSVMSLILFPLSAGYAILRYNLLVFDSYVRKIVVSVVSAMGLILLTFALFTIGSVFVSNAISIYLASLLLVGVIGGPCIWWLGGRLIERAFFPEMHYYKRILKQVQQNQSEQSFDVQQVAHLVVIDIMTTLGAPGACVFVLDEETHTYNLLPSPSQEAERTERVRTLLLAEITQCLSASEQEKRKIAQTTALAQQLLVTKRPLFLSEVAQVCEEVSSDRVGRYMPFVTQHEERSGPLLAPLRSPQGDMIGFVLVSERGDEQRYGGPDLEALVNLLHISAPQIETARQFGITTLQQERTAQEREAAYEQQRHLNEMKDRLIIHMSHELRTPLAEVQGYIELMKDFGETLDAEQRDLFLSKAAHGCDELLQLLSTILSASQSDPSTESLNPGHVAIAPLLTQEVSHLDPLQSQAHTFAFQIGDENLTPWADEQSTRQIVRNLLSNALKYSPEHSTISVGARKDKTSVLFFIHNEGEGISQEEMPLLFQKFMRLERHHSGSIRGTGLGLYICKEQCEAMGGQIWAESSGKEGEGTSFYVRLPLSSVAVDTRTSQVVS